MDIDSLYERRDQLRQDRDILDDGSPISATALSP